jgi:neutral ceramidase
MHIWANIPGKCQHIVGVLLAVACITGGEAAFSQLRAGASAVKITPPPGIPMAGYYSTRLAEGVHDDLFAKAIVLEEGGVKVALVALDLISTTRELVDGARKEIDRTTGVRSENVMISATHAHTGPILATTASRDAALGGSSEIVNHYNADLQKKIAQSVKEAEAHLAPARLSWGIGEEEHLSYNRRFFMKDGSVGWNPGKLNPNILKPAGPIDPEVSVLYIDSVDKKPIATYVNFAMHLDTVGGVQISADYPYTLSRLLAEYKGLEMITLFANGCCGNINHLDVSWPERQQSHGEAARIATVLAADVLQVYKSLRPAAPGSLRVRREIIKLPIPSVKPDDVVAAKAIAASYGTKEQAKFLETVGALKVLDVAARDGKPQEVEVQVISLGNEIAWVSLPGEIFVELGLAIKKTSPFKLTVIAELANGSIGYIPDRAGFDQGNYEAVSARCAKGSGEALVDAAVRMLKELHRLNE